MLIKRFTLFVVLTIIGLVPFWVPSFVGASGMSDADVNPVQNHEDKFLVEPLEIIPVTNPPSNLSQIIAFAPPANTHNAPLTSNLTLTMSGNVSQPTVTSQTISIQSAFQGRLDGAFTVSEETITFDPDTNLHPGELVQTTVTTDVVGGVSLEKPYVWQFRTQVTGGSGIFNDSGQSLGDSRSFAVAGGDVDGDGSLDFFIANADGQANQIWLNDGTGIFTAQSLGNSNSRGVILGDLNGDGDLDAFVANAGGEANQVWLNDGDGTFSDSGQNLGSSSSVGLALGDLNGDGSLDAFVGNWAGQGNKVWLNDGNGIFSDSGQSLGNSDSEGVVLGDVDSDGDLDAFLANFNGQANKLWLNDGSGTFSDSGQSLGNSNSVSVAFGDVNDDGSLDALVANYTSQANKVWLNDGTGIFTNSDQNLGNSSSTSVAFGDLDGDHDLDAFVANENQANKVWLNDGSGTFTDSNQNLGSLSSRGVALGDLDGDGDLDAFVGNKGQANKVWLNGSECLPTQICNGDFEQGTDFWNLDGETELVSPGHDGNLAIRSVQTRVPTQTVGWAGIRQEIPILPGQVYSYTIWVKSQDAVGGHLKFGWLNAADEVLGTSYPVTGISGDLNDWTKFHGQVMASPGATKAHIAIWHGASEGTNAPGSTLWIDDISVTPIECTTVQICDGDFEEGAKGWFLNGTTELVSPGHRGNYALSSIQTKPVTATIGWLGIQQNLQVVADQLYQFTAWLNAESATGTHMKVGWFDSAGQVIETRYLGGPPDNSVGWVKEGGEITAPTTATMARITIWHGVEENTNVPGSHLLIDDVTFTIAPPLIEPAANTHNAPLTSNLTITMSQSVSQTTVTSQTIPVHSGFQGSLDGTFTISGETITFDPDLNFHPGELVQTTVTTDVVGDVPLEKPYVWQFRTGVAGGSGGFKDSGQNLGDSHSFAVALGDLDGDNDIDAVVGNSNTQASKVWLNDETGTFSDSGQSLGTSFTRAVALGDIDNDQDLDIIIGNRSEEPNEVWLNDGDGTFTDNSQSLGDSATYAVAVGDIDGDGDLDAFFANDNAQANQVWLNDGTGTFTDSGQNLGNSSSRAAALGDVDNDGDLDVFVGNILTETNKVWLNNGAGIFTDSGQNLGSSSSLAIALGDVDSDGDIDAFVGNGSDQGNKVWLNDGTGTFSDSGQSLGVSSSYSVALGDLDGDASLDAFVANRAGQPNKVWLNDGTGTFSDSSQTLGNSESWAMALADLDHDGDLDAFVGNTENQPNKVWLNQNIIYVDTNASGTNNGTSWGNAFIDLQDALAAAEAGDEIWVAAGTYKPTDDGDRTISFELKNGVGLYGGFKGTETAREQRHWLLYPTRLSGDLSGNDNHNVHPEEPTRADNSYHVVIGSNTDSSAILDGFVITAGNANGSEPNDDGGGMYNNNGNPTVSDVIFNANSATWGGGMFNSNSSPDVSDVTFIGNSVSGSGAGMYNSNSSHSMVMNVTFTGNSAGGDGGGMANSNSSPRVMDVTFNGNSANSSGGGMFNFNNSSPTVMGTTFTGNSATWGGGMLNSDSSPTMIQVSFKGNSATSHGGGMYNGNLTSATVTGVIFTGNSASDRGGGMYNSDNSSTTVSHATFSGNLANSGGGMFNSSSSNPTVSNSILWNNKDSNGTDASAQISGGTPTITYSLVQGGWSGTGNIDADPLFISPINPDDAPTIGGDFHLQPNSPAIDAGDNNAVPTDTLDLDDDSNTSEPLPLDLDGAIRFQDHLMADTGNGTAPLVDMGAYETGAIIYVKADATGANNGSSWTDAYIDLQDALAAATVGHEIWVAEGTYKPTDDENRAASFHLKNGVRLYGGFNGTEQSHQARDWEANQTILSGDLNGNDNANIAHDEPTRDDNSYHVLWAVGIDRTARVDGFTIRDGNGNFPGGKSNLDDGGGMRNDSSSPILSNLVFMNNTATYAAGMFNGYGSNPTLIHVTFTNNIADDAGGMLNNANSHPTLLHVTFTNNAATLHHGGGMYNRDSYPILNHVTFTGNSAGQNGGGMYNRESHPMITDATFTSNDADYGGGMYNEQSSPTISNVIFSGNLAHDFAGGILNRDSSPTLNHVTFSHNSAGNNGGGMFNAYGSNPLLSNLTFVENSAHDGAGMYNDASNPTLRDIIFSDNSAVEDGGGILNINNSNPTITNATFTGNSAHDGGGMYNSSSNPTVTNATFKGNIAEYGGGIFNFNNMPTLSNVIFTGNSATSGGGIRNDDSSPILTHATFTGNHANNVGGGIANFGSSSPQLSNSILWNNQDSNGRGATSQIFGGTPSVTYSLVQGGWSGTGNIDPNPLFISPINPNDAPTTDGNFHIQPNSPAIDAGNNDAVPLDVTDIDGDNDTTEPLPFDLDGFSRFLDAPMPDTGNGTAPIVDMGAYEQVLSVVINEVAWAGTQASADDEWIELYNNSPNPIDLTGWTLSISDSVVISLTGMLNGNDYYLLERDDDNTVSDTLANLIYTGYLNDAGGTLLLRDDDGQIVDTANSDGEEWPAGNDGIISFNTQFKFSTMERINSQALDTDTNWATNDTIHQNGQDASGQPLNGTPKEPNSITYPESDDHCGGATEIEFDDNNQSPNYFDILRSHSDQDLFKFEVLDEYTTIKAELTEPADFELSLYFECDENQLGQLNHIGSGVWKIGGGVDSISFNISQQRGTYYLKVNAPNDSYSGRPYRLNVVLQAINVSDVESLIFYNHQRFSERFAVDSASTVMTRLTQLAAHETVMGTIIQLDQYPQVQAAYAEWDSTPISDPLANIEAANQVVDTIRSVMIEHLGHEKFPNVEHIVLIGDDYQIPFRRIYIEPFRYDSAWVSESQYTLNNENTSVGAALLEDYTLTDNIYGSLDDFNLLVPDLNVGRVVDTPERILSVIDSYIANNGLLTLETGAIAGYDFLADAALAQCESFTDAGVAIDCSSMIASSPPYPQTNLYQAFLANEPYLVSHNWHADHTSLTAPDNSALTAQAILNASLDLDGRLWSLIGCHTGLMLPGADNDLSLPQALSSQGITFIGNTGWGWGAGDVTVLSEQLYQLFTDELTYQGSNGTVGEALQWAKEEYYYSDYTTCKRRNRKRCRLHYHQKVISQATLFGLPMLRLNFPNVSTPIVEETMLRATKVTTFHPEALPSVDQLTGEVRLNNSIPLDFHPTIITTDSLSHKQVNTPDGIFYTSPDGEMSAETGVPLLPQQAYSDFDPELGQAHGVLWLGGSYSQEDNNPVINTVADLTSPLGDELDFEGLYPRFPVILTSFQNGNEQLSDQLLFTTAQFEGNQDNGMLRLFNDMTHLVGVSSSDEFTPPQLSNVDANMENGVLDLSLSISDDSGVYKAYVTYTEIDSQSSSGVWQSTELITSTTNLYSQQITYTNPITYFIQVMDKAGNVAIWPSETPAWDTTPPTLTLPSDITRQASSLDGAVVTFTLGVTDNFDPSPVVVCIPASGSLFPVGSTSVSCTATDLDGNNTTDTFNVTVLPPTTIVGSVILQSRPQPPHPDWVAGLRLSLTIPGESTPRYSFTPITDQTGTFTITNDIEPGTYEARIKKNTTLQNTQLITLTRGINNVDFGTLLEGDANDDNFVILVDFSILVQTFSKCEGDIGYDERADFTGDDCITILDFSRLATNFGLGGDLQPTTATQPSEYLNDVNMLIEPASTTVKPGAFFTVSVQLQADNQPVDGVQATLNFDPDLLEVVQMTTSSTLPLELMNQFDNQRGTIEFAAGALDNFPSGTFDVVAVQFRALAEVEETTLAFQFDMSQESNVTFGGASVLGGSVDGVISVQNEATAVKVQHAQRAAPATTLPLWLLLLLGLMVGVGVWLRAKVGKNSA